MDIATHILAGRAAGKISGETKAAALAGMIGGVLPDTDSLALFSPPLEEVLERRGCLHSIVSVFLTAVLITLICSAARKSHRKTVFLAALGGGLTHLLLDVITPWGVPLLWPLSRDFSLGITRGFDPWISLLVLAMTYFTWPRGKASWNRGTHTVACNKTMRSRCLALSAGFLILAYLALRLFLQAASLETFPDSDSYRASSYALSATNPFRWRVVMMTGESIDIHKVVVPDRPLKLLSFPVVESPCIELSKSGKLASRYLRRAEYPHADFFPGENISTVVWRDMRDQLLHTYRSGEVRVTIDCKTGKIVREEKITWLKRLKGARPLLD
ncbi:MAG: metal-dependent hydrolase [Candidatus Glassbacteria bacterium]